MKLKSLINENISLHKKLIKLDSKLNFAVKKIFTSISLGKKVMICGNGGSAADAQHLAAEFLIRLRPKINRKAYPVISLAQTPQR